MGIKVTLSYEMQPGDKPDGLQGTLLGDILLGDIPTAIVRMAAMEQVLQQLVGAENVSLSLHLSCPVCDGDRAIDGDGVMDTCPHCGAAPICLVQTQPENFFDAIRRDPTMKEEQKAYWLALEPKDDSPTVGE
jgi:hypothetical protein